MKKIFTTILTLVYFLTTTGASMHLHYCMDKLVEQSFWESEKEQCSKCGMDKSQPVEGCCKDEIKLVKGEKAHVASEIAFQVAQLTALALPVSFIEIPEIDFTSVTEDNPTSNAPPRSSSIAIYKRNCVFRI